MNLDDRLGLAELGRQPLGFSLEPLVFGDQGGVGVGLPPTTLGGQADQRPFVALLPPGAQVRRVQALTAQQSAELAWFGAAIGLAENAKLVLRREPSPHGLLRDGRVVAHVDALVLKVSCPMLPVLVSLTDTLPPKRVASHPGA